MGKPYFRAGVVAVVQRDDGKVMAFERSDREGAWQLPQGGMDEGETPLEAAWRELEEETGLTDKDVKLVREHGVWTSYVWPKRMQSGDRIGQTHRWFFFAPRNPKVEPTPDGSEFGNWKWMKPAKLISQVVDFRKGPYEQVLGG